MSELIDQKEESDNYAESPNIRQLFKIWHKEIVVDEKRIRSIIDFKWMEDANSLFLAVLYFDLKSGEPNPNVKQRSNTLAFLEF